MTRLNKPIFFIATVKPDESRQFYESRLDLTCLSEDPFALVFDLGPTNLRIQKVESIPEINYTVLGWEVTDIVSSVNELANRGVTFEMFPQLQQKENGIWLSPSGASIAWFKDPDNNTLSLTESGAG